MIALRALVVGFVVTVSALRAADLGTEKLPPLDTPLITGELGFLYHTGGHTITSGDWKAFLDFADRHLGPGGG